MTNHPSATLATWSTRRTPAVEPRPAATPGRLTWREPADALLVSVHRFGHGWGVTATWPHGRGAGAARDTREEAMAAVPDVMGLAREREMRRVGSGKHG